MRIVNRRTLRSALAALSVLLVMSGCSLLETPRPGELRYTLPTEITVPVGQKVPGTDILFQRIEAQGAILVIKGQEALKRKGDSVDWSGSLLGGTTVDLRMRVAWFTEQAIYLAGTARIRVEDAQPRAGAITTSSPTRYTGPVAYSVAKGGTIPGTTATFVEKTDDGARIGGIAGYPYRKAGDSLLWEGALRDGLYCRLDVRIVQYDDRAMRVAGLVTLWLGP